MPLHIRVGWKFWAMIILSYFCFLPTLFLDLPPYNTILDKICALVVVVSVSTILYLDVFYPPTAKWFNSHFQFSITCHKRSYLDYLASVEFSGWSNGYYSNGLHLYPSGNYVYIIKDASASGYYKIGKTNNLMQRIHRFEVIFPFTIHIWAIIPCENMSRLEADLHQMFQHKRVAGEWFNLSGDDLYKIMPIELKTNARKQGWIG